MPSIGYRYIGDEEMVTVAHKDKDGTITTYDFRKGQLHTQDLRGLEKRKDFERVDLDKDRK